MKTCPVCKVQFTGANAKKRLHDHRVSKHGGATAPKPAPKPLAIPKASASRPSSEHISNEEIVTVLSVAAGKSKIYTHLFWPGATGCLLLDKSAVIYSNYKIKSLQYKLSPTVGTTRSGYYVAGIDYDTVDAPNTVRDISALSPKAHQPVWKGSTLRVDPSAAMRVSTSGWRFVSNNSRTETDMGPAVMFAMSLTNPEAEAVSIAVWVKYSVEVMGPDLHSNDGDYFYTGTQWETKKGTAVNNLKVGPGVRSFEGEFTTTASKTAEEAATLVNTFFQTLGKSIADVSTNVVELTDRVWEFHTTARLLAGSTLGLGVVAGVTRARLALTRVPNAL